MLQLLFGLGLTTALNLLPGVAAGYLRAAASSSDAAEAAAAAAQQRGARAASERPAWGRDYGPDLGLGRDATIGGPCGGQSYQIRAAPRSGQEEISAAAPDISGTDLGEHVGWAAGSIADSVHHIDDGQKYSWAGQLVEDSCEKVCMRCTFESLSIPGRAGCRCAANCLQGPDSCACDLGVKAGWTANHVTAPTHSWRATCGGGDRDCMKECLNQKFLEAAGQCLPAKNKDPASCIGDLEALYSPFLASRRTKVYCSHKRITGCDVFDSPPVNTSRSWRCFPTWQDCTDSKLPSGFTNSRESKSVWGNVWSRGAK